MEPGTSDDHPTIYSIGYEALEPDELVRILSALSADLIDVRSKPQNNRARADGKGRFNRSRLVELLGRSYQWHGDTLGGMGAGVTDHGICYLLGRPRPAVLMCVEEAPGKCHRHIQIAVRLLGHGIDVAHIYQGEIVLASDLQAAIDSDGLYSYFDLHEVLAAGGFDILKAAESSDPTDSSIIPPESSKSPTKSTISKPGHREPGHNDHG
jgi:hypothetical protein